MFLATTNPSVCKITRELPLRTVLNDGKFYTFDNGSCTLYTESGYLNTTNAGPTAYYYFPNNDGCGSGVATCFTGCDWSNLNSWRSVGGEVPELLPFSLSSAVISSACTIVLTCNSGPIPYVNSILFCGSTNGITLCGNNISLCTFGLGCYSVNYGTLCGDVYFALNAHNYGIVCATGGQTITTNGFNYGSGYGPTINVGKGNERNGLFSGENINFSTNCANCGTLYGNVIGSSFVNCGLVSGNIVDVRCNVGVVISKCTTVNSSFAGSTGVFCSSDCITINGCFFATICSNPFVLFTSLARNCSTVCTTGNVLFDSFSKNFGTVCTSGNVLFKSTCNDNYGVVCAAGNVSFCCAATNSGNIFGLTCFIGSNINYCCIVGNAYFNFNAKNCGTVSGTGFFKNLACNSGTVTCACLF